MSKHNFNSCGYDLDKLQKLADSKGLKVLVDYTGERCKPVLPEHLATIEHDVDYEGTCFVVREEDYNRIPGVVL